ncbi:MAG: hypothetical protein PWP08_577, partial [Methanofollis sp.]|nr:hypothetical protein [Methanofollis sp.]
MTGAAVKNGEAWVRSTPAGRAAGLLLILLLLPVGAAADQYVGGIPLTTVESGDVSGDLWFDAAPAPDWGQTDVTRNFTLPAAAVAGQGRITWARLYVAAYCGHMQNDKAFAITNRFDGNGDGVYETTWAEPETSTPFAALPVAYRYVEDGGNDNTALGGGLHDPYRTVNDHMNRVTSDYLMWYDVTDLIQGQTVGVNVNTTGSYDGRVKSITLVVAYNDPDSTTETRYWVNQGHDVCSYYFEDYYGEVAVGTTAFNTAGLSSISSATLTSAYMASNNGLYGFPTAEQNFDAGSKTGAFTNLNMNRTPDVQGPYSGVISWNVTDSIDGSGDATLGYARDLSGTGTAAFFKIPLAFLVVKSPLPVSTPVADFTANVTGGDAPLTVRFTDLSANAPTAWSWDFGDNATSDEQHPTHTYAVEGTYTVSLTATNTAGSDTEVKTDCIAVTTAVPDLTVSTLSSNNGEVFSAAGNTYTAKITNIGTGDAGAFAVGFNVSGATGSVSIDGLAAGANTTLTWTDGTIRDAGATVTIAVTADAEHNITESNEDNNLRTLDATVVANGYRGKRWTGGADLTTAAVFDVRGDLVYSSGDSVYLSSSTCPHWTTYAVNWTAADLSIPANATIAAARLYVPYTWDKGPVFPDNVTLTFNDA